MNAQKDMLARLLATENLTVLHDSVETASFDVANRVLRLPVWKDMQSFTYDHLIGHEVGHALYTPADGWESEAFRSPGFKSFLNVVEDARIEKLIQRRYPGLRRHFIRSYKQMLADGFFGVDENEINHKELIDRINLYFKCGTTVGVKFSDEEMHWVDEIEACETWEQAIDIAERLFADATQKMEEERAQEEQALYEDDDEAEEEFQMDGMSDDGEEGEEEDSDGSPSSGEADDEDDEEADEDAAPASANGPAEPMSDTASSLEQAIRTEYNESSDTKVTNVTLNEAPIDTLIAGYKTLLAESQDEGWFAERARQFYKFTEFGEKAYSDFMLNNKRTINYMVKEFEMKKRASEYARQSTAKTGVIDPVLMNSYKYNDDIFRKVTITPEGKNHGMIMYLDWSGSMHNDLRATVEQTLNLVMFCRQVNIPHRVYAFTSQRSRPAELDFGLTYRTASPDTLVYGDSFMLLELFSEKMRKHEFATMAKNLLTLASYCHYADYNYRLGSTPLNHSIMAARKVFDLFKKQTRVDLVSTIFLTDGDSHDIEYAMESKSGNCMIQSTLNWHVRGEDYVVIHDLTTKKRYRMNKKRDETRVLLKAYRDYTGSNALGFRIMPIKKNQATRELSWFGDMSWARATETYNQLKKDRYVALQDGGYDKFFILAGGKHLETANGAIEVAEGASKASIRTAFKKANNRKLHSRTLLNEFIHEVA